MRPWNDWYTLRAVEDLGEPLPEALPGLASPALLRAWQTLRILRAIAARLCREDRNPDQMDVALLRYAVHTAGFDESSPQQRRWALSAAGALASDIEAAAIANRRLRIDWIEALPDLGMTLCPGRRDKGRDLAADLDVLLANRVSRVLCLLPDEELEQVGVSDLRARVEARGLTWLQIPVKDQGVCALDEARRMVRFVLDGMASGERTVMHCMGGLGRTGTVAACTLVATGLAPEAAIALVRRSRGPRAVENRLQEEFVTTFSHARVDDTTWTPCRTSLGP